MKRLTNIKRSKSPTPNPSSAYSMDNPVFEDSSVPCNVTSASTAVVVTAAPCTSSAATKRNVQLAHPVHVR